MTPLTSGPVLISHRGNISGPNPYKENSPEHILEAISMGFEVEVDVWCLSNDVTKLTNPTIAIALGHDRPQYIIEQEFLFDHKNKLWLHCKNLKALFTFGNTNFRAFYHDKDDFTLTTNNLIWTYPGKALTTSSVVVLQKDTVERFGYTTEDLRKCYGICSDDVLALKKTMNT